MNVGTQSPHHFQDGHPTHPPKRHPAFNAGSVLYERGNREAFNAVFERMGFCIVSFPRPGIRDEG